MLNIDMILNSKTLEELLDAIDEFCRESYMRDDDSECMNLKERLEVEEENDILMLLSSYLIVCEDGDEVIEALYEFAGNCKGFVEADKEMTQQVTKEEFEQILDECEDKCALRSCVEYSHTIKVAQVDAVNKYREFSVRFKGDTVNVLLSRIDINTDIKKYISEELGTILYGVLATKLTPEYLHKEINRYIAETRKSDKTVKELFKEYFYDVVLYKERKPGIYTEFDDHMKRVLSLGFFRKMIEEYQRE